jgi:protein-S-isoprenylcysteine O-methyltransferase Ste14
VDGLLFRVAAKLLQLPLVLGVLLFLPAGTFDYREAWVFIANFFVCTVAVTIYIAVTDPKLLERRMRAGPGAEKEKSQKRIMAFALFSFPFLVVLPAIDRRFTWSSMPTGIVILGNVLIVLSFLAFTWVMRENSFAASTIVISEGQKVISTGPYSIVRHPMYSGALVLFLAIPLALGSGYGLLMFFPSAAVIVWRLLDEEKFLKKKLPGYSEYTRKVRYRLVPGIW